MLRWNCGLHGRYAPAVDGSCQYSSHLPEYVPYMRRSKETAMRILGKCALLIGIISWFPLSPGDTHSAVLRIATARERNAILCSHPCREERTWGAKSGVVDGPAGGDHIRRTDTVFKPATKSSRGRIFVEKIILLSSLIVSFAKTF